MLRALLLFAASALLAGAACNSGATEGAGSGRGSAAGNGGAAPEAPRVKLIDEERRNEFQVFVELARSPDERARGLMHRRELAEDHGMLFLFPREQQLSFWMKNTLIPLDMIFIREDLRVLGVVHEAEPMTLDARRVPGNSRYVLEVNGGWAAERGIDEGDRVEVTGVDLASGY